MRRRRAPQLKWNFLRENDRLRGVINARFKQSGLTVKDLGRELDIAPYLISYYLRGKSPSICNYDIIRLCSLFSLEVDLDITFGEIIEPRG